MLTSRASAVSNVGASPRAVGVDRIGAITTSRKGAGEDAGYGNPKWVCSVLRRMHMIKVRSNSATATTARFVAVAALGVPLGVHFTVPLEDNMAATRMTTSNLTVKITPNDKGNPPGKLADAELHFTNGVLAGLKLIGFSVWKRRNGVGRNVTFPARH